MKQKSNIDASLTIKQLAQSLQNIIDSRLETFMEHYEELKVINGQIEELEKKMTHIVIELEPVESLVLMQNPSLHKTFESLKRVYTITKEDNESDTEAN